MNDAHDLRVWTVGKFIVLFGFIIGAVGALVLIGQTLFWLKFGVWHPTTVGDVSDGFGVPIFHPHQDDMVWLQRTTDSIVNFTYGTPASLFFLLLGAALCLVGVRTDRDRQRRLRNANAIRSPRRR